jgi:kynurenine formamidase
VDLRPLPPAHGITAKDLRKHEALLSVGTFVLLKTGWGDHRANTKEFLTEWPYMTGDGAKYLVERGVKGMGIDGLSVGGYGDQDVEGDAHLELLSHQKLLLEDIHIPDALLDGKQRFFAAFPILVANASGAWVRAIVWDQGDLEGSSAATETPTQVPAQVAALISLERV